jgi:multidrug efflux pump subunit AcrA (membrane-fusion protein)
VITNNQIATISLNEVDAASVKVGQKATLTFDAVTDLTLTGHVSAIDTIGTVSSGVVSYGVTIAFDTQDDRVKPGMSTTAAIVTNIKQDVLLVPNAAVKSNTGGNYVMIPSSVASGAVSGSSENGVTVKQQTVIVGLSDDNYTEIVSGSAEGDTVVVKTATQTATKASTSSSALSRILGGGGPGR